ncbi:MAG: GSU3473 family protein [Chloroflexota bacterium]
MYIRVVYRDRGYDYVSALMLDRLLDAGVIKAFFRPLSKHWVYVGHDKVRGAGGVYSGPERRKQDQPTGQLSNQH